MGDVRQQNRILKKIFPNVRVLVLDESMCGWMPKTTKYGGLPHLTFQIRKPISLVILNSKMIAFDWH